MTLDNLFKRDVKLLLEISFLYFLQGVPYGLQTKYIPLVMRRQGTELSFIGLSNLVSLPWILKFTWANLFDRFGGTGRKWVAICLSFLSLFSLCLDSRLSNTLFLSTLVLMNFFSASLDIAVDALAIKSFDGKDLGYCNICHVVGYKIGILFGGGLLISMSYYISLLQFKYLQSLFYALAAIYFVKCSNLFCTNHLQKSTHMGEKASCPTNGKILKVFISREQLWMLVFVFFYKMGEQGFASMYPLHLIDNDVSLNRVGMVSGIFGQIFSIAGSSFGGILISKFRIEVYHLIFLVTTARSFVLIMYSVFLVTITSNFMLHIIVESTFQLLAGTITTATFTAMMMMSKKLPDNYHALHFTILATCEVLGKLLLKLSAGLITENVGYENFFFMCCILDLFVLFITCINFLSRTQTIPLAINLHQKKK